MKLQAPKRRPRLGHTDGPIADNGFMEKLSIRQILAKNLNAAMERSPALDTQGKLADAAGISQSHLSEILRSITSVSIDLVGDLAAALKVEPWELLADSETTRQVALEKLLWRAAPAGGVHESAPAPPLVEPKKKGVVVKRKKKPPRDARK